MNHECVSLGDYEGSEGYRNISRKKKCQTNRRTSFKSELWNSKLDLAKNKDKQNSK